MITFLLVLLSPLTMRPVAPMFRATPGGTDTLVVHFGFNQSTLSRRETVAIDRYLATHKGDANLTISGYCDDRGSTAYNDNLSLQRARAVKQYLIEKGLAAANITKITGFGTASPVDSAHTEVAWAKNRRVVIIFEAPAAAATSSPGSPVVVPIERPESTSAQARKVATPSIRQQLTDTGIHVGSKLTLRNVNFFAGYHIPMPGTTIILDTLVQAMLDNPNLRLHIDGYVCCLPDSSEGKDFQTGSFDLSIQRAKFVYDYLVKHHVAKERLAYEGHGSTNKLYPAERDPREMALNRRVEITVVAK